MTPVTFTSYVVIAAGVVLLVVGLLTGPDIGLVTVSVAFLGGPVVAASKQATETAHKLKQGKSEADATD